jgi:hypothetical protein
MVSFVPENVPVHPAPSSATARIPRQMKTPLLFECLPFFSGIVSVSGKTWDVGMKKEFPGRTRTRVRPARFLQSFKRHEFIIQKTARSPAVPQEEKRFSKTLRGPSHPAVCGPAKSFLKKCFAVGKILLKFFMEFFQKIFPGGKI